MKFIDEIEIVVQAGQGGAGAVHFHREKYVPNGGPDGGDGGRGGDVILKANPGLQTLGRLKKRRLYAARRGGAGASAKCSGKNAEDLVIHVPVGTQVIVIPESENPPPEISERFTGDGPHEFSSEDPDENELENEYDKASADEGDFSAGDEEGEMIVEYVADGDPDDYEFGEDPEESDDSIIIEDLSQGERILGDLVRPDQTLVVARGGIGGLGNQHFATSSNQSPTHAQPGRPGERFTIRLNLKLLADVGLIGLPNAGKSTLLSRLSRSSPRIADYPFTTLTPNLGVIENEEYRRLLIADIPGIIEGASMGAGLGLSFLRHIERVGKIVYVFDIGSVDAPGELAILKEELRSYSPELLERPAIIVLNKMDLVDFEDEFAREIAASLQVPELWQERDGQAPAVVRLSALENQGLENLIGLMFQELPRETFAEKFLRIPRLGGSPASEDES